MLNRRVRSSSESSQWPPMMTMAALTKIVATLAQLIVTRTETTHAGAAIVRIKKGTSHSPSGAGAHRPGMRVVFARADQLVESIHGAQPARGQPFA
jgi:hypothetical protein